jgi:hypothetical protein
MRRGMTARLSTLLHRAAALAVLLWFGAAWAGEVHRTVERQVRHPPRGVWPSNWRYGTPQTERLRHFLERAAAHVPAGEPIAFASLDNPAPAGFFRFLWASYFLADRDLIPASHPMAGSVAKYCISYATRLDQPYLTRLYEDPAGAVYRVNAEPRATPP